MKTVTVKTNLKMVLSLATGKFEYELTEYPFISYPDREIMIEKDIPVQVVVPELNEDELRLKLIQSLEDKKKKILADAQKEVTDLDATIKQLLLITHQPANTEEDIPSSGDKAYDADFEEME